MDESDLTKKIGGLPVWAWGAIIVVGSIVIKTVWARTHPKIPLAASTVAGNTDASSVANAADSAPSTDTASSDALYSNDPFAQAQESYLTNDPTNPAFPTYSSPNGGSSAITDAQWGRQVQDYLVGLGDDPSQVATAIANYLGGGTVTSQQKALLNQGITKVGSPPEGVLPFNVSDTPAQAPDHLQLGDQAKADSYLVDYNVDAINQYATGAIYQVQQGPNGPVYHHLTPEEWSLVQPLAQPGHVVTWGKPPNG